MSCKYIYKGTTYNSKEEFISFAKENLVEKTTENQFLKLLEKDNQWITFMTKAVLQNAAKKGFTTVRFPKGDTAGQIENFIQKVPKYDYEKITSLEKSIENAKKEPFKQSIQTRNFPEGNKKVIVLDFKDGTEVIVRGNSKIEAEKNLQNNMDVYLEKNKQIIKNFEKQLQELKSIVNASNYTPYTLSTIENINGNSARNVVGFYEETITNILNKQGYNPKEVTDEFGNKWNEVQLSDRDKEEFLFQRSNSPKYQATEETTGGLENLITPQKNNSQEKALEIWARPRTKTFKKVTGDWELVSKAMGAASRVEGELKKRISNPDTIQEVMYETSTQAYTSDKEYTNAVNALGEEFVRLSVELYPENFLKENPSYVPAIKIPLDSNGEPKIEDVLKDKEKGVLKKTKTQLEKLKVLAERLSEKFGGMPYEFDTALTQPGKIKDGKIIINPNLVKKDTLFHEFAHIFVAAIKKSNPSLYKNLVDRASKFTYNGVSIREFVIQNNPDLEVDSEDFNDEIITTSIGLAAVEAPVEDKNKFSKWLATVYRQIAKFINSLISDPSKEIDPANLNVNMTIEDLGVLMNLENKVNLEGIDVNSIEADQTTSAATALDPTGIIEHFTNASKKINLVETSDESYYTDGTRDPKTGELKKFERLTSYSHEHFAVTKYGDDYSQEKSIEDTALKAFKEAGVSINTPIFFRGSLTELTYDQVKDKIRKDSEHHRMKGKILHKNVEGYIKHEDKDYFSKEIEEFRDKGEVSDRDLEWFDENRIKSLLAELGLNSEKFGNKDPKVRDYFSSELTMVNPSLSIGTANDLFVVHSDGSTSFIDFKTGERFLHNEHSTARFMQYSKGLTDPIEDSTLNRAKVELVMRMIMAKLNKPDLKVRDLKIAHVSKFHGTHIRNVDVPVFLDYIDNNFRLSIQNLTHQIKKHPELKASLEGTLNLKKEQYAAMKAAKVFDFHTYVTESNVFGEDSTLDSITDPKKKVEYMRKIISQKANSDLTTSHEIRTNTLDETKKFLYKILNNFKSANEASLESAKREDIDFLSKMRGLRDMNNAFLKVFSRIFEESQVNLSQAFEKFTGEQSEFRKRDRELRKEFFERTKSSQITGAKLFSYPENNAPVPLEKQGLFDFMYTLKVVGNTTTRVGAVYDTQGTLTDAQWAYYKTVKSTLKEVYNSVRNKVAYVDVTTGLKITYGEVFSRNNVAFPEWSESFLPVIPFQSQAEIVAKNHHTGKLSSLEGIKDLGKDFIENYDDRYNLAIQNETRFNIGLPLKYMPSDFVDRNDHSFDVTTSVEMFTKNMLSKLELDEVYNLGKLTQALMSDSRDSQNKDKIGRLLQPNAIAALNDFLDQNVLGRRKITTKWSKNEKRNIGIDRGIDNIGSFISKNAFWFAPVTSGANALLGLLTSLKEGTVGSVSKRFFGDKNAVTLRHVAQGLWISFKHLTHNSIFQSKIKRQVSEDWKGTYYQDKVNYIFKTMRLNNKSYLNKDESLMMNVHNRVFTQDSAYFLQGLGEDFSNETLVIATLKARKVDVRSVVGGVEVIKFLKKDGTYTEDPNESGLENMWDIYKRNDVTGEFEYTGPTRFLDKDGIEVKGLTTMEQLKVKQFLERMYGGYSPEQRASLERFSWGRALMKFRKFQILNIRENFTIDSWQQYLGEYSLMFDENGNPKLKNGQPLYDWHSERTKARIKVLYAMVGGFLNTKNGTKWKDLSLDEKKQLIRLAIQLVFLGFLLLGGVGAFVPPEDKNKKYVEVLDRLAQDMSQIHVVDILRGASSIDSYPETLLKVASALATTINSVITGDRVKTGKYKGDYIGINTLENYVPIKHSMSKFYDLLEEMGGD